jgi:glutamine amidotransferase
MTNEKNKKVVIVDYAMGNIFSVKLACQKVGICAIVSNDKKEISNASALILPGVGAFADAMATLEKLDLVRTIKEFIASGRPFLGICLGMQLLMSESEEFGLHKGLDIIKGRVVKFPAVNDKVPQVGWNQITKPSYSNINWEETLLKGLSEKDFMYFVHSFYVLPNNNNIVVSETNYAGLNYCSSLREKNIYACQFHPEKSGESGLLIYRNFYNLINK